MAAMFGGMVGQEVIKAVSGKFHPLHQWLYFDAIEALPLKPHRPTCEETKPSGSRYDAQIAVFGRSFQDKLAAANVFLVGAGALGCEFLKNFALMGVACSSSSSSSSPLTTNTNTTTPSTTTTEKRLGHVTVTDDDQIERSNLSRQFLFRDWDVGQPKSGCGARAAQQINPTLRITPL